MQASLGVSWAFSVGAGLSALLAPSNPVLAELGLVHVPVGIMLFMATAWALAGVIFNRYRWEWLASWVAAVAATPYTLTLWGFVAAEGSIWLTQAFLLSSLTAFYVTRGLLCSAHAAKLREIHKAGVAALRAAENEGDEDDGGAARAGD